MRFYKTNAKAPRAPIPNAASQPRWRSLWSRVYHQKPSASPVSPVPTHHAMALTPTPSQESMTPQMRTSHTSIRAYFHRKRGELWFLTKRRQDCELRVGQDHEGECEEVEVQVFPPLANSRAERHRPQRKPSRCQSRVSVRDSARSFAFSEIAITMSSFSSDSQAASSDNEDGITIEEDDDDPETSGEEERDSYDHDHVDDLLRQRHSSWCSIDDEQHNRGTEYLDSTRSLFSDYEDEEKEDHYDVRVAADRIINLASFDGNSFMLN